MVKIVQKGMLYVLYLTIPENKTEIDTPFISLSLEGEEHTWVWDADFHTTLEIFCQQLSEFTSIEQIVAVNTEGELYIEGKFIGFTTPKIYRVEVLCKKSVEIKLNYAYEV